MTPLEELPPTKRARMDFLAGYGSGSDAASDKDEQQDHVEAGEHILVTVDLKLHLYLIYRILLVFG